jgi:uncharacterized protein (DUF1810 family)
LFGEVAADNAVFAAALAKYFDGRPDARTLSLLQRQASSDHGRV